MFKIGTAKLTNRIVYYLSTISDPWIDQLPSSKWLVLSIIDTKDSATLDKIAKACLDKNVEYICAVGSECEHAHDWFDETIVERRINNGQPLDTVDDFEDEPMTTWHNDFSEGFWFALTSAFNGDKQIDTVVCLDTTEKECRLQLMELLAKINTGWLPPD